MTDVSEAPVASTIRALKRRSIPTRLQGATSQKRVIFILDAVKPHITFLLTESLCNIGPLFEVSSSYLYTKLVSFGRVISPSQRPLPTQDRNTKTNIHASRGIQTHDPRNQAPNTYAFRLRGHRDRPTFKCQNRNEKENIACWCALLVNMLPIHPRLKQLNQS
jgi:hypothetical protein